MNRARRTATVVHRYTGLVLAAFLTLVGLTGAVIAWNDELERVFAPSLFVLPEASRGRPALDAFTLRELAERRTGFAVNGVDWTRRPDQPALLYLEARPGGPAPPNDQIALDPATGAILGVRHFGDIRQGMINLMPFVYELHDSLAMGSLGITTLGIIALLWTIDCFVGAYLTFPARSAAPQPVPAWIARWLPAWGIRWRVGGYRRLYDLHRAGGLWPWTLMLPIAWSSVAFNLPQIYRPVMQAVAGMEPDAAPAPARNPTAAPLLGWRQAHARVGAVMAQIAREEGLVVKSERLMFYDPLSHRYSYRVLSDRDPGATGNTQIVVDGDSGALVGTSIPTGRAVGTTITSWIQDIHVADVLSTPMKIVMTLFGLAVASLSGTGVLIWARKQRKHSR